MAQPPSPNYAHLFRRALDIVIKAVQFKAVFQSQISTFNVHPSQSSQTHPVLTSHLVIFS